MALIQAYLHGNEASFAALYMRYRTRLIAYLNRLLQPDFAAADDIFQQVWLRVIQSLGSYSDRERFISWLFRVAHNLTIDHIRRNKRRPTVEYLDNDMIDDDSDHLPFDDSPDRMEILLEAVAQISDEQREVVLLRREGVSFKEIAEIQGVPLNTAIGRMHDAVRNIRRILRQS